MTTTHGTDPRRKQESIISLVGLVYSGIFVLYVSFFESPPTSASNPYPLIADLFALVLFAAALLISRGRRSGYLIAIPMSIVFLILFSSDLQSALTGFADYGTFLQSIVFVPVLVLVVVYSFLGLRKTRRDGGPHSGGRSIPLSSLIIVFIGGFVIGGSLIGAAASGVESRLLTNYGSGGNVTIVFGASNHYNGGLTYSPSNYTVKVGTMVTWVNKDTAIHTVTSQGSNLLNSGDLPTGAEFSFTFTQPGTYHYYCTYHTFMVGTITVTP